MDLFYHSRPLADQLMASMQAWVASHRTAANGVRAADIDAFDKWIQERDGIAATTASNCRISLERGEFGASSFPTQLFERRRRAAPGSATAPAAALALESASGRLRRPTRWRRKTGAHSATRARQGALASRAMNGPSSRAHQVLQGGFHLFGSRRIRTAGWCGSAIRRASAVRATAARTISRVPVWRISVSRIRCCRSDACTW